MKRNRWLLLVVLFVLLALVSGCGFVLWRDGQLCAAQICLLRVSGHGLLLSAVRDPVADSTTTRPHRGYYVLNTAHWIARVELDTDGDGAFDCRQDDCLSPRTGDAITCISNLRDGRWIPAEQTVSNCAFTCDGGSCAADAGNDEAFWTFGFGRRAEIEAPCDGGVDSCRAPLECFPAINIAHVVNRFECHLRCKAGDCPQGYVCAWIDHGPRLPDGSTGVCLPNELH